MDNISKIFDINIYYIFQKRPYHHHIYNLVHAKVSIENRQYYSV